MKKIIKKAKKAKKAAVKVKAIGTTPAAKAK